MPTYRLPAEWEPQESVWFVWPRDPLTWPDRVEQARAAIGAAARAVAAHQDVHIAVHPDLVPNIPPDLTATPRVHLHPVQHQDSWIRDYGPLTLIDDHGHRRLLKFRFDAWGEKYESLIADDDVVPRLAAAGSLPDYEAIDFVLEGGAVETDGQGTFLATESVAEGRGQTLEDHEATLRQHLGARHVIWLSDGIQGDDTDGHIDTITRFVASGKILTTVAPPGHPDHAALADNRARLADATDAHGRSLDILELPVPEPQTTDRDDVLPAGYANFLITNGAILLPQYGCPQDNEARQILAASFPKRDIIPIDHQDLIWGFGGIHCLSMQIPRRQNPLSRPPQRAPPPP